MRPYPQMDPEVWKSLTNNPGRRFLEALAYTGLFIPIGAGLQVAHWLGFSSQRDAFDTWVILVWPAIFVGVLQFFSGYLSQGAKAIALLNGAVLLLGIILGRIFHIILFPSP